MPATRILDKINAIHELHREKPMLAVGEQLIELHQVGVVQVRQTAKFLLETEKEVGVRLLQDFQRDSIVSLCVIGEINDTERAFTQAPFDPEALRTLKLAPRGTHDEKLSR
jgi:hypothetical protein